MKIKYLFLIAMLCLFHQSFAQISIFGSVIDSDNQPVSFANVLLVSPQDSALIKGTVTDSLGRFQLANVSPGAYRIQSNMIGFQTSYAPYLLSLSSNQTDTTLAAIQLLQENIGLDAITVTAKKPIFIRLADRTIVNVQNSPTLVGNSALQVLERSPGVSLNRQSNSLSMYGKTGVRIMINGKASRLPADAVIQMLDGMSAANIASIELITSPSSDFDAEGNGGIINIVLKENLAQGTNGNLGFTLGYNQAETLGANFNLNHRAKKVNLFLDYTIHYDKYEVPWDNSRFIRTPTFEKKSISLSDRVPKKTVQNLRAGIEYLITPDFTLNALVTGYRRGWDMNAVTTIENVNHPDTTINTLMQLHEDHIWDGWTGNLGFDYKWNDVHKLVVNYDYLFYKNTNPSNYDVSSTLNTDQFISQEKIDVSKLTPIHFNVLSADYTHKLKPSLKIKAGLKGTLSKFNNDVLVRTLQKETWRVDPTFTNESELEEQILAGYTAVEWEQSEDLQISAGLRYEYTDSYLSTPDQKGLIDRQFGNFFPSFRLSKRWAENQKIQFAYSKRITRPNFNDMAPFVFFIGPNTFVAGNPALRPAVSNGLDLSYNYKRWWLSLKYSYTENSIGFLQPEIDEAINQQILRSQNLDFLRTWSFSNSLPIDLNNWWELQTDLSVYHHTFKTSNFTENFQDDVLSFDLNLISTISLPKKHTLEMTANYQSRTLWGIWQFNPMFMVNIGGSKKLKNGTLSLNIADVFNTWTWSLETQLRENNTAVFSESDIDARAITIGYTHNFGNRKLEKVDIQLKSEEERKRVN